jgi:hypothetical protein
VNQPTTTLFHPFEATRPMVKQGVLAVNPWEEASGLDPEAVHVDGFVNFLSDCNRF